MPALPPRAVIPATFDGLQAAARATLEVLVSVEPTAEHPDGLTYQIPCLHLTPAEEQLVVIELRRALPPIVKRPDGQMGYDLTDTGYEARAAACRIRARSLALLLGVKILAERIPEVTARIREAARTGTAPRDEDVTAAVTLVQNWATEHILVVLYEAVCPGSRQIGGTQEGAAYATFPEPPATGPAGLGLETPA